MESLNLWVLINPIDDFIRRSILTTRYWKLKVLIFSCFISFTWLFIFNRGYIYENFRSFYADVILHNPQPFFFWNGIVSQGESPFTFHQYESGSHQANRIFRLTIPLIAHYFHLNPLGLYLVQVAMGFLFLRLLIDILAKVMEDKILTFYLFFTFVNVYVGACFFFNCFGHGDGYTFFFMLCALLVRSPILISLFCQLAFWCDERSVIVALSIWLFHYFYYHLHRKESLKLLALIIANIVLYLLLRVYLARNYQLASEDIENFTFERYFYFIKFTSMWYGKRSSVAIEGFALVIPLVFIILLKFRQYGRMLLAVLCFLPIVIVSFLVGDTVRTLSFSFIFWLIAFIIIKKHVNSTQLKALILIIAFINLLIPVSFP